MTDPLQPQQSPPEQHRLIRKLEARRESYADRGVVYKTAWTIAGFIVLGAGLAMTVLPGPALIVIPAGLAMLSFQFAWAQWALDEGLERSTKVGRRVKEAERHQKILLAMAVLSGVAAVAVVAWAVFA